MMKAKFLFIICSLLLAMALFACDDNTGNEYPTEIVNGGFELGTENMTGWKKTGTAFSFRGVIKEDEINGIKTEKTGEYFFSGLDGGTQKMTGTLSTEPFKLSGTGKIAFKMGAAKYADKIHVDFYVEGNETPVLSVSNTDYNEPYITTQMIRKIADLSQYVGKVITIVIVDNDNNDDYGYVNLDDFVVCLTDEDVAKYEKERADQLALYAAPEFNEDPTSTDIQNPGFETGDLTGWKILSGAAFGPAVVIPTDQYYWNDRLVYGEGEYYMDGNNNGSIAESAVGVMRSSKFTLAGDGYISFMIGAGSSKCYVALCDGETDEELIKVTNEAFNDPKLALTLLRVYMDASNYKGKVVYLKVVDDNPASGFAFINVDDFRVSLTVQQVKDLQVAQLEKVKNETYTDSYNSLANLVEYYSNYNYLFPLDSLVLVTKAPGLSMPFTNSYDLNTLIEDVVIKFGETKIEPVISKVVFGETEFTTGFDAFDLSQVGIYTVHYGATHNGQTVEDSFAIVVTAGLNVTNGDFESGDMAGWTLISGTGIAANPVINAQTFWGEKIAYNKGGEFHFDGWTATGSEPDGYAYKSDTFILSGTGMASFKMGGNAAVLKVYLADGTLIGNFKNYGFVDVSFPLLSGGCRLATMNTYYYDFSAYLGCEMYVVIEDDANVSGWAVAFFDDINFNYEEEVDFAAMKDTVAESNGVEEMVDLPWLAAQNRVVSRNVINGDFEMGALNGWKLVDGTIDLEAAVFGDATFWGEKISYNQGGSYHFDGWKATGDEGAGYALRSNVFTLSGSGWVSFKMGGKAAQFKVYLADGTLVASYDNTEFADVAFPDLAAGCRLATMVRFFADLSQFVGQEVYVEIVDNSAVQGWAVAFFDDINCYFEEAPVTTGHDNVKNSADKAEEDVEIAHVVAVNTVTDLPTPEPTPEPQNYTNVVNGDFEAGSLEGWTVTSGEINTNAAVISAATFWAENISYNQGGSYHFDGWGATGDEGASYVLKSNVFTLSGSGWVSFKMGGNAARFKVYLADGTLVASYSNTAFADVNFPDLSAGCRLATMTTYFADLSQYVGQEVYVEIVDSADAQGWAVAFFDDVNCYYEEAPVTTGYDVVKNAGDKSAEDVQIAHIVAVNTVA